MSGRALGTGTYVGVCAALIALTAVTLGVSFAELPGALHLAAGLTIGALKAALVLLFFMHALRSERVTWMVIAVTVLWLGILFVLTFSEYFTRGFVPHMPGH